MRLDIRPVATSPVLSNLTATPGIKSVQLKWDVPSDPTYKAAQVWTGTTTSFAAATLLTTVAGNTYTHFADDTTSRYYWVRAVNIYDRADGAPTGPMSGTGRLIGGDDIAPGAVNLATHITGLLAAGNITGLGALALVSVVDANTQVTNLGDLAYADKIAANQIGAGTLAAGVVYAGKVNADQVNAGIMTGHIIQSSSLGKRVIINESSSNTIRVYDSGGTQLIQLGGGSGNITLRSSASVPGLYAINDGGVPIFATSSASGAISIIASASSGTGLSVNGRTAIEADGPIIQEAYSEASNKSVQTNNCIPVTDNTYNCGTLLRRWMGITSATAVVVSSDERTKKDISDSNLGLDFITKLRPVTYRLKVGKNEVTRQELEGPWPLGETPKSEVSLTPVEGKRFHYGLIAQEVRQVMTECGVEDAAFWALENPDDPDSTQALRYEELIPPLIKAVQELTTMVKTLEAKVAALEAERD